MYKLNTVFVLSAISNGLGYKAINEIFSLFDIKTMKNDKYKLYEDFLSDLIYK